MGDFVNNLYDGSHYELSVQYANIEQAVQALATLNKMPMFHGDCDFNVNEQVLQAVVKTWPNTIQIDDYVFPCLISLIHTSNTDAFIDIAIPTNEFLNVYEVQYPLDVSQNPWLVNVHYVLLNIAESLYDTTPFLVAVLGEEITGSFDARNLTVDDVEQLVCVLPSTFQHALNMQHEGLPLSTKLALYE